MPSTDSANAWILLALPDLRVPAAFWAADASMLFVFSRASSTSSHPVSSRASTLGYCLRAKSAIEQGSGGGGGPASAGEE